MKKHLTAYLIIATYLSISAQSDTKSLNGIWKFKAPIQLEWGDYHTIKTDLSTIHWDSIAVPGNWDTENEYTKYVGEAAYYRTFELPSSFSNGELFIHFDAVYYEAKVYINGNYLGQHSGGYTPFEFCITDMVKKDSINELTVLVNNEFSRGAWWSWGGISRNVSIHQYADVKVDRFMISATPDFENGKTTVSLSTQLENLKAIDKELQVIISFDKPEIPSISTNISLSYNEIKTINNTFTLSTKGVKLWHFDDPNLYTATIQIKSGNKVLEERKTRFGIRKVEVKGTQFLLNNEPVRAFGFNRVSDHRAYGNTEPFDLVKRDIDHMKSLGCVLTRIMHTPQLPELLDYCDEVGMLLIAENPVWSKFDPNAFANSPIAKQWFEEMIVRDYNHPSIIAWSVANEIGIDEHWTDMRMSKEQFRYVSSMLHYIKSTLDSTRLLTYASFTAFRAKANKETDPAGLCDFISFNSYGDVVDNCKQIHSKWPDKPIFITEFGRGMIGENINTSVILPVVYDLMNKAKEFPYLMGASLWTYNDYRSRYRGTPPSENRAWGVVDVWRNPKIATKSIRELFVPVKEFNVSYADRKLNITFSGRTPEEMPNISLKNYYISVCSAKDEKAIFPLTQFSLKNNQYSITLDMKQLKISGDYFKVSIMTPTHFPIADKKIALKKIPVPQLIHSDANPEKMQVSYLTTEIADNYILHYNGKQIPLMSPTFEIQLDKKATEHRIALEVSDDNGKSSMSKTILLKPEDKLLPPVIQHIENVYNGYVIGFTVEKDDEWVEVEYSANNKTDVIKSTLKGSFKIIENHPITNIRIRKYSKGKMSGWSKFY
jgi:beta-galactosidase